jgi:branched-subunit amino acid ABC-type transport system permease component
VRFAAIIRHMFNFKDKPYNFLLFGAVVLILLILIFKFAEIEASDTAVILIPFIPIILVFCWLLYWMTERIMYSTIITKIHIIVTLITAAFLVTLIYIGIDPLNPMARRYYDNDVLDNEKVFEKAIPTLIIILFSAQFLLIVNLVRGFLAASRIKTKSSK